MSTVEAESPADRLLQLTGVDEPDDVALKLELARQLLTLHVAVTAWHLLWVQTVVPSSITVLVSMGLIVLGATGAFVASLLPRLASWAAPGALLFALWIAGLTLPATPEHVLLGAFCLTLFVVVDDRRPAQAAALRQALVWAVVLVIAWAGLQKLVHGAWTDGTFLSVAIATGGPTGAVFEWAVPPAEVERLRSLDPTLAGEGPFRAAAPLLVAIGNGIWVLQLLLPLGLLHRATRVPAVAATLGLVFVFDLFASREILMSLLLSTLLVLAAPRRWLEHAFWPVVAVYVLGLAIAMGLVPGGDLLKPTWVPGRPHL
jgi:hypothetical protein